MVFEKQKPSHLSAIKCRFSALEGIGIGLLPSLRVERKTAEGLQFKGLVNLGA